MPEAGHRPIGRLAGRESDTPLAARSEPRIVGNPTVLLCRANCGHLGASVSYPTFRRSYTKGDLDRYTTAKPDASAATSADWAIASRSSRRSRSRHNLNELARCLATRHCGSPSRSSAHRSLSGTPRPGLSAPAIASSPAPLGRCRRHRLSGQRQGEHDQHRRNPNRPKVDLRQLQITHSPERPYGKCADAVAHHVGSDHPTGRQSRRRGVSRHWRYLC